MNWFRKSPQPIVFDVEGDVTAIRMAIERREAKPCPELREAQVRLLAAAEAPILEAQLRKEAAERAAKFDLSACLMGSFLVLRWTNTGDDEHCQAISLAKIGSIEFVAGSDVRSGASVAWYTDDDWDFIVRRRPPGSNAFGRHWTGVSRIGPCRSEDATIKFAGADFTLHITNGMGKKSFDTIMTVAGEWKPKFRKESA